MGQGVVSVKTGKWLAVLALAWGVAAVRPAQPVELAPYRERLSYIMAMGKDYPELLRSCARGLTQDGAVLRDTVAAFLLQEEKTVES